MQVRNAIGGTGSGLRRFRAAFAALALQAVLFGCGGSGSDSASSDNSSDDDTDVTAPTITAQPVSLTVTAGDTATFTVTASGDALGYQWYLAGSAISGATSTSLVLASTTTADAGSYYVVVSNSAGSATSDTVTLTVAAADGTSETWNLATGANDADIASNYSFTHRIAIALDTMAVTVESGSLTIGAISGTSTPLLLNGTTVMTVDLDQYGVTVTSDLPDGEYADFVLSGTYAGSVTFLSEDLFQLTLNGAHITSPDGPALNLQSGGRTFLVLADGTTNTLADSTTWSDRTLPDGEEMDLKAALFSENRLVIDGDGALDVSSVAHHAIASDDHVRVIAGTLAIYSAAKDGIRANDAFIMDGGDIAIETAAGAGKGIKVKGREDDTQPLGFIAINAGTLDINSYDKAITASWEGDEDGDTATTDDDPDPLVTINGGTITITTFGTPYEDLNTADGDDSLAPEGIESKSVLTVNGGDLTITTTDDGLNAGEAIVITGGRIYVRSSTNDAIDSNGRLTLAGGVIVADGANGPEGGFDNDNYTFTVSGGTFVGIGGRNSVPTAAVSTQNSLVLGAVTANTLLVVRDTAGNVATAFLMPEFSTATLLGSPLIATGGSYQLYAGGTVSGQDEVFHGLYLGSAMTHAGGTARSSFTVTSRVTSVP